MDKDPTQKPQKTAYDTLKETQDTIDRLAKTQPEVPIQYPERYNPYYRETYPAFTARGVELGEPETRQEGLDAFMRGTDSLDGETHLILKGERNGEPVTLVLKRSMGSFDQYKDGEHAGVSAYESPFGGEKFKVGTMQLGEDGETLSLTSEYPQPEYEGFDGMRVDGMYLVPKIERQRNYDQVKASRFTRALRKVSGRVKGFALS